MADTAPPRDFEALRQLILARRTQFPKRVAQIAIYAIENADDIAFSTTADIARKSGVQPSTLVRFAQTLGFRGFSELQLLFRARLKQGFPDYRARIDALKSQPGEAPLSALLHGFAGAAIHSLERLEQTTEEARLEAAITLLAGADRIYLVGTKRAFPVTAYLAYALAKLGISAHLIDQIAGLGAEQLAVARPGDVVLALSFAPYAPATLDLVAQARARGIAVLALTDSAFSPLVPLAAAWLEIDEADHGAFRTLSASFALAMTLAVGTAERREEMG